MGFSNAHPVPPTGSSRPLSSSEVYGVSDRLLIAGVQGMSNWVSVSVGVAGHLPSDWGATNCPACTMLWRVQFWLLTVVPVEHWLTLCVFCPVNCVLCVQPTYVQGSVLSDVTDLRSSMSGGSSWIGHGTAMGPERCVGHQRLCK
jgi:hypothetical protein